MPTSETIALLPETTTMPRFTSSLAVCLLASSLACGSSSSDAQTTAPKSAAAEAEAKAPSETPSKGDAPDDTKADAPADTKTPTLDAKAPNAEPPAEAPTEPPPEGAFVILAADAEAQGLPRVGITMGIGTSGVFPAPAPEAGVFASFSGPPGGDLGVRLVPADELEPTAEAITAYAKDHDKGDGLTVQEAQKVRIAGVDRWVAVTLTKTHRGSLGTAWVWYPGIEPQTGVMVRAWAEVDAAKTTAQTMVDRFKGIFDSLKLTYEVEVTTEIEEGTQLEGMIAVGSDGRVSVLSVEGDADDKEYLERTVGMVDGIGTLAFKAPPPAGSPRYTLGARVYERSDVDYLVGLHRKLADYDVKVVGE